MAASRRFTLSRLCGMVLNNYRHYLTSNLCYNTWRILSTRGIHSSTTNRLKEIQEREENGKIIIEGVRVRSPHEGRLVQAENPDKACPLCATGIKLQYSDVLILSQFLRPDGCMIPRRVTGLCKRQQNRVQLLVQQAQKAGLMPQLRPANRDGTERAIRSTYKFKRYNRYYEDEEDKTPYRKSVWH